MDPAFRFLLGRSGQTTTAAAAAGHAKEPINNFKARGARVPLKIKAFLPCIKLTSHAGPNISILITSAVVQEYLINVISDDGTSDFYLRSQLLFLQNPGRWTSSGLSLSQMSGYSLSSGFRFGPWRARTDPDSLSIDFCQIQTSRKCYPSFSHSRLSLGFSAVGCPCFSLPYFRASVLWNSAASPILSLGENGKGNSPAVCKF